MAKSARFYQVSAQAGSTDLHMVELPVPEPGAGQVRIKVDAIALNRAETMYPKGQYLYPPLPGSIPGYEAAGTIDALGEDVYGLALGDRVSTVPAFSMREYGVYGEYAIVPAHAAVRYPDRFEPEQAAAVWMQYLTAYGALVHYAKMKEGDYVLVTAAAGGVGIAAIQLARMSGAVSIAVTRKESKREFLDGLGADYVIVLESEDLAARVVEITHGHGIDIVFDPVAGPQFASLAELSAPGGQLIVYGGMGPDVFSHTLYPFAQAALKGLSIRGYTLFELTHWPEKFRQQPHYDPVAYPKAIAYIQSGLESGALNPVLDTAAQFSFEQLLQAHQYFQNESPGGKVVVRVGH